MLTLETELLGSSLAATRKRIQERQKFTDLTTLISILVRLYERCLIFEHFETVLIL